MKKASSQITITDLSDPAVSGLPQGLAQPARRALAGAGILSIEQLAALSETEVRQLHGIGPKAVDLLHRALGAQGLSFADEERRKH